MFVPPASFAVITDVPLQLFTTLNTGAAGAVFGAGVTLLLATLIHPLTVLVAVTAVVVFTVIGLPVAALLHVNSPAGIFTPAPSFAVITDVPSQLFTTLNTGAACPLPGAGVTLLLATLIHPLTVLVAVTAVVVFTVIGLPVAALLHVNSPAGIFTPAPSFAVIVDVLLQLSTTLNI